MTDEEQEREIREHIEHWVRSKSYTPRLHVPDPRSPSLPWCHRPGEWTTTPVAAYPIGHKEICGHCRNRCKEYPKRLSGEEELMGMDAPAGGHEGYSYDL